MSSLFLNDAMTLAFFGFSPGYPEMMIVAGVALMLYGGKLPEVARSWGKTFAEFRRGLTGLQSEFNDVVYNEPEQLEYRDDNVNPSGYDDSEDYHDEASNNEAHGAEASNSEADSEHDEAEPNPADHLEANRKDDNLVVGLQEDPHLEALNQTGNTLTGASAQTVIIDAAEANASGTHQDDSKSDGSGNNTAESDEKSAS